MKYIEENCNPKTLHYSLWWEDSVERTSFTFNNFKIYYDYTDDGNYNYFWQITKVDNSQFSNEEFLSNQINTTQDKLENLKKYRETLEKVKGCG